MAMNPAGLVGLPEHGTSPSQPPVPAAAPLTAAHPLRAVPGVGAATPSTAFQAPRSFLAAPMAPAGYVGAPVTPQPMMPPGVLVSAAGAMSRFAAPGYSQPHTQGYPPRPHPQLGPPPGPPNSIASMPRPIHARPLPPVLKPPAGMSLSELAAKGVGQLAAPMEKTHTTVYVGKISPTVEDDVVKSILELCGAVRSWKRAQDPTSGSPRGFGFCEFESVEGVLRAGRLLNKFALDGQELVLNVNPDIREYLERYVSKKRERQRILREEALAEQEEEAAPGVEITEHAMPVAHSILEKLQKLDNDPRKFGLVTEHDVESDSVAMQKLTLLVEERAKLRPLPLPLPVSSDAQGNVNVIERSGKSKDGDSGLDVSKSDDLPVKVEDDISSDPKGAGEERMDGVHSDRGRRSERDRERDREREMEREKDREIERYERERERERLKRERDRENRSREAEHLYEEREREWEAREREKERQRVHDRERERDRERDRHREIKEQEEEVEDEDWRKRRYRESLQDEKRKRRQREREEDLADLSREEQDAMELKRQRIKDCRTVDMEVDTAYQCDAYDIPAELPACAVVSTSQELMEISSCSGSASESERPEGCASSNGVSKIAKHEEGSVAVVVHDAELKVSNNAVPRKLGFGLMGSGRRAAVPSVFYQEDEEEMPKERMLRPLVPIEYTVEEMQAVAPPRLAAATTPIFSSNLAAAAEFAKSLSNVSVPCSEDGDRLCSRRERDRLVEKDRSRRDRDRGRYRERERVRERHRDKDREKFRDKLVDRAKENESKVLDAKQLIDTIPKTREELFAYPVDWKIYDQHGLQERMRPWISKKITEFLGEEESSLVEFIVNHTQKHVTAANMLALLESILDDEAEMFVLKMWRMLIFEIRRVETGLASRGKA